MATETSRYISRILILAGMLMLSGPAQAVLIHSYVASDSGNTVSVWQDGTGSTDWNFPNSGNSLNAVTGSNTHFTQTYTTTGPDSFGAYADPLSWVNTGSISIWFRNDLLPGVGSDFSQILFEDGGTSKGFAVRLERNSNSLSLRLTSKLDNDFSVSLDALDFSDFIQGTVTFDGANATLYAYSSADGTNASGSAANDSSGGLAGGNGAGLFISGNDNGSVNSGTDLGGGGSGTGFEGDIAAVYVYNHALTPTEIETQFNSLVTIPEPGTLSLLGLSAIAVLLVSRRRHAA